MRAHYLWELRPHFRQVAGQLALGSVAGFVMNTAVVLPAILLGRAIDARDPDAIWILNSYPVLHPLRKEPRYQQLLERMGLPAEWRN